MAFLLLLWALPAVAAAEVFTVNTTVDSSGVPGGEYCTGEVGVQCTLREAIGAADLDAEADTIGFEGIPAGSVLHIEDSSLPTITQPVTINGHTAAGAAPGVPALELLPTNMGEAGFTTGFAVHDGTGTRIEGFAIGGFSAGIEVAFTEGTGAVGTEICGNYLGTELSGEVAVANIIGVEVWGVNSLERPQGTVIGDPADGCPGNVISGNGTAGVADYGLETTIAGNAIGIGPQPTGEILPNGTEGDSEARTGGVLVEPNASGTMIGGTDTSGKASNLIAHNAAPGVFVETGATGVSIRHDSFTENEGLGIEIAGGGPPVPTIASAKSTSATKFKVEGTVEGEVDGETVAIEVFGNPACDPSTSGEGQTFLGTESVQVAAGPNSYAFSLNVSVPEDDTAITATATREDGTTTEFSTCATYGPPPPPQTFEVTTTEDVLNGECSATSCSLRAAIEAANATEVEDTIVFGVTGTIKPEVFQLPAITAPVTIDGTSAPTYSGTPVVEIDGSALGVPGSDGLLFRPGGSGSTVAGLAIGGFEEGVYFEGTEDKVCGSYLGVEVDGTTPLPNANGVEVWSGSTRNQIGSNCASLGGGNLISGNSESGILDRAHETHIAGNQIGVDAAGEPLGNGTPGQEFTGGILLTLESFDAEIGAILGAAPNVIAFNHGPGIIVPRSLSATEIRGNSIFANAGPGIKIEIEPPTPPTVESVSVGAGTLTFSGKATAGPGEEFIALDFFADESCDPSGSGQGQTYLGTWTQGSLGGPTAYETEALTGSLPPGQEYITATSTGTVLGQTTEFSHCFHYLPAGETFTVTTLADGSHGECAATCTLRDAIEAANESANEDTIDFGLAGKFQPLSELPAITAPVTIDATSAPTYSGTPVVEIDGEEVLNHGGTEGLVVASTAEGSAIKGLAVTKFDNGIVVRGNHTLIEADTIAHNGDVGLTVDTTAPQTAIRRTEIFANGTGTIGFPVSNSVPEPVLESFVAGPTETTFRVPLSGGEPDHTYAIDLFADAHCEKPGEHGPLETFLASGEVTTDSGGEGVAQFVGPALSGIDAEVFTATATDLATGTTSQVGHCAYSPIDTKIESKPPAQTSSTSATFTFAGETVGTVGGFECSLDGATFATCTTPREITGLAPGSHTFEVRALNGEGTHDPTPASYTWEVDTTPPVVTITAGPAGATTATEATFEFTATDSSSTVTSVECSLDGATFSACTSPKEYTDLENGPHTFEVKATDALGNTSAPVSRNWTVDTNAPEVTITAGPSGATKETTARFEFQVTAGDSEVTSVECSLDGAEFGPCESPQTYTGLAAGVHTFEVEATNAAGNTSEPAVRIWKVQTAAPPAAITTTPAKDTSSPDATFEFSEAGSSGEADGFECSLDDAAYAPCASPASLSGLAPGPHTFAVRTTDEAGNRGEPTVYAWTVAGPPAAENPPANPPGQGPAAEPEVTPTNGETIVVKPEEGKVKIKLPGTNKYVSLEELKEIPVGATIDATKGKVKLTSIDPDGTEQAASFFGGVFKVKQKEGSGLVVLELLDTGVCPAARASASALPAAGSVLARPGSGSSGKLWGSGHGNFKTEGNQGAATVRGTIWLVEDRCNGTTFFRTRRGVVSVRDFFLHKTLSLPAGNTYVAGEG